MTMRCVLVATLAFFASLSLAPLGAAQRDATLGGSRVQMTRPELESLLQRLDESVQSSAYSGALRDHAVAEAALVRARLADGDFQVGDRIVLRVEGETTLTDTFTVGMDRALTLPIAGPVRLDGVLHSELEPFLTTAIGKYIRNPVVHARSLVRLAVLGQVVKPGFYTVPTEMLVTDAIMLAGGPTADAKLQDLRILRGDERIWDGKSLQEAMVAGRTIDQLSVVAGDRIEVPKQGSSILSFNSVTVLSILIGLPSAVYGLTKLF